MKSVVIFTLSLASGGAEKVISLFLPELIKKYKVNLVLFHNIIHFDIPSEVNIVILDKTPLDNYKRKILYFPRKIYQYYNFINQHKPDISISFLTRPNFINGIMKYIFPNLKVIMSERGYPSINYRSSKKRFLLYKILIPFLYNRADVIFSNSKYINEDLSKNFGVNIPLSVINNPVISKEKKSITSSFPLKLITIGSLRPIKNQRMILEAIRNLPNTQLTILGDGQLRNFLEQKSSEFDIQDRVHFEGVVKDVFRYLKTHDCFILSSNSEGFPNVLLEAMSVGLPVISTNCLSGPLEILNNDEPIQIIENSFAIAQYGILINVGDDEGLNKAIQFLQNNLDFLRKSSNRGYERAKFYNIDRIYSSFEELMLEA